MHAIMNNTIPNPNLFLLFSKDPAIMHTNARNPQTTGIICENIVVPTIAILNH